jgi:hypothetical protein
VNVSPKCALYHGLSIRRLHFTESLTESDDAYDANKNRFCGWMVQVHAGKATATEIDFMCLGGMLMINLRMSPSTTACKCSLIASMCQLS